MSFFRAIYEKHNTLEDFERFINEYFDMFDYIKFSRTKTFWNKREVEWYGDYYLTNVWLDYSYHCSSDIIWISSPKHYIYVYENILWHTIVCEEGTPNDYFIFEDKLYHLTHGTNPLSIPDAFKVLSL